MSTIYVPINNIMMNPCIMHSRLTAIFVLISSFRGFNLSKLSVTTINLVKTTLQTVKAAYLFENLYFRNIKTQSYILLLSNGCEWTDETEDVEGADRALP